MVYQCFKFSTERLAFQEKLLRRHFRLGSFLRIPSLVINIRNDSKVTTQWRSIQRCSLQFHNSFSISSLSTLLSLQACYDLLLCCCTVTRATGDVSGTTNRRWHRRGASVNRVYRHRCYIVNRRLFLIPRQSTDSCPLAPRQRSPTDPIYRTFSRKQTSRWDDR